MLFNSYDFCEQSLNLDNAKYVLLFLFFSIFCMVISFMVITYVTYKFLKQSLDDLNIFFYKYNKTSQEILDAYGDCKLTNLYIVRQPVGKFTWNILNILSLFELNKLIKEYNDGYPYHTSLIFEVKLPCGSTKLILLEKNNSINICTNFFVSCHQEMIKVKLDTKNNTINSILEKTRHKIGDAKFFNWHLNKYNCQIFIKQILKTMGKYNKTNKNFIFKDKILNKLSDFTIHTGNCLCIIYNIIEKYIGINILHLFYI